MKTDALIAMLARADAPVAPRAVDRRLGATAAAALALTLIVVLATLGARADFAAAAQLPMFWWKLVVPLTVGTLSFIAVRRLAKTNRACRSPGTSPGPHGSTGRAPSPRPPESRARSTAR